jgi:hypothetical protein
VTNVRSALLLPLYEFHYASGHVINSRHHILARKLLVLHGVWRPVQRALPANAGSRGSDPGPKTMTAPVLMPVLTTFFACQHWAELVKTGHPIPAVAEQERHLPQERQLLLIGALAPAWRPWSLQTLAALQDRRNDVTHGFAVSIGTHHTGRDAHFPPNARCVSAAEKYQTHLPRAPVVPRIGNSQGRKDWAGIGSPRSAAIAWCRAILPNSAVGRAFLVSDSFISPASL